MLLHRDACLTDTQWTICCAELMNGGRVRLSQLEQENHTVATHHICVCLDAVNGKILLACFQTSICAAVQLDERSTAVVTGVAAV